MAFEAHKTEHAGAKRGRGAYYGYKRDAKKESNRKRRSRRQQESGSRKCAGAVILSHQTDLNRGDK
jgi:hypothetical protein